MSRSRKTIFAIAAALVAVIIFAAFPGVRLFLQTSIPGHVIRWCLGEPGATQGVNDAIERINYWHDAAELQELGDKLISEFGPISSTLPDAPFSKGKSIPLDRLPQKYRELGGLFGNHPDLIFQPEDNGTPRAIIISWAHMRKSITIFFKPPASPPRGFFVRKLNNRIYVVAGEE
jgi:hypothetical protein